ncbi:hypothetical protein FS749_004344 [Ceratobasidium sp. UAMH 11750]|nr:hypothetical protein FS749_004344 [Ceratobasidium sp. UAMH 11750]
MTVLVIGNHILHYAQVRDIAFDDTSTLYHRDTDKLNCQDDQAASRLACAATLEFILTKRTDYLGLAVYLFVFGELCDAYRSRQINHAERFKMAMRAHYFLELWMDFLKDSGYPLARYFISREACNILMRVANGLVLLMIVYRDHFECRYPLLPWLCSTESCEHTFAELRKLVPDFTYQDLVFAIPKLRVLLRTSYQNNHTAKAANLGQFQAKKATGYYHSCSEATNLDYSLFYNIPTSFEMSNLLFAARSEATQLIQALGVVVRATDSTRTSELGPSITIPAQSSSPDVDGAWAVEEIETTTALEALHAYFIATESGPLQSEIITRQRDNIIYATSMLGIEGFNSIEQLAEENTDSAEADRRLVNAILARQPQTLHIPDIDESLFTSQTGNEMVLEVQTLVACRKRHQTEQAYRSPKNFTREVTSKGPAAQKDNQHPTVSQYTELARTFYQTLRDEDCAKIPERVARWSNTQGFGIKLTGNSANAKQAADKRADLYVATRRICLPRNGVRSLLDDLSQARITTIKPLRVKDYVWVLCEARIELGRVCCIYTKGGGSHGAHSDTPQVYHLGHISYIGVQIFEPVPGTKNRFRATRRTSTQDLFRFEHVHVSSLLVALGDSGVIIGPTGEFLEFTTTSCHLSDYRALTKDLERLKIGLATLSSTMRRQQARD